MPTTRSILEHIQRIESSESKYPIILSQSGVVMDGIHRVCKALLKGEDTIKAVQFKKTPDADKVEPYPAQ